VKIRRAETNDFLPIAALDRAAWGRNRNADYIPDGEHAWRIWVEHAQVFCAEDENAVVQGAILGFLCENGAYCVHKVFVADGLRKGGIGSKLFSALLAEIDRKGADCFLTVDPHNSAALALYEKWGFTDKAFVSGYYRETEDRYVLARPKQTR